MKWKKGKHKRELAKHFVNLLANGSRARVEIAFYAWQPINMRRELFAERAHTHTHNKYTHPQTGSRSSKKCCILWRVRRDDLSVRNFSARLEKIKLSREIEREKEKTERAKKGGVRQANYRK